MSKEKEHDSSSEDHESSGQKRNPSVPALARVHPTRLMHAHEEIDKVFIGGGISARPTRVSSRCTSPEIDGLCFLEVEQTLSSSCGFVVAVPRSFPGSTTPRPVGMPGVELHAEPSDRVHVQVSRAAMDEFAIPLS